MTDDSAAAQRLAGRVAGAAELLDIRLFHSESHLHDLALDESLGYTLNVEPRIEREDGAEVFVVSATFGLEVTRSANQEESIPVATVKAEFGALYDISAMNEGWPDEAELTAYADTASTLTLFPYAREFFNDMTSRLGLPRLVLPIHRIPWPGDTGEPTE